jgi:putative DNA primase/helicase
MVGPPELPNNNENNSLSLSTRVVASSDFQSKFPCLSNPLSVLSDCSQWVFWNLKQGRKLPFDPKTGTHAKSNDPSTWGTLEQAQSQAPKRRRRGGVGIELGPIQGREDVCLGGVDLDTCRDPETGRIETWAQEIIARLDTYCEVSPSQTGVKLFFLHTTPEAKARTFKQPGKGHPPGIELYFSGRYFTVTNEAVEWDMGLPYNLRMLSAKDLGWLVDVAGPKLKGNGDSEATERDGSSSGAAFRKAMELQLAGKVVEAFEAWTTENPWSDFDKNPERAIQRTWERAGVEAGKIALTERREAVDFSEFDEPGDKSGILITMAAEIEPEPIDWIWKGYLAKGKGMIFTGLPGVGKSTVSIAIASTISNGGTFPGSIDQAQKGTVLILSSEDAANDTIVPRIMAAGGDRDKIGFIRQTFGGKGKRRMLNLKDDLDRLAAAIKKVGDVSLVIIDPITAYMGSGDSHKTADVRAVLDGVSEWAQGASVAVLAITHPAKAVTSAMNAAVGSQAFVAFFRTSYLAGFHPDDADKPEADRRRVLSPIKVNITKIPESLCYTIEEVAVRKDITSSKVVWGEPVAMEADELLKPDEKTGKVDEAEGFLKSLWDFAPDESIPVRDIEERANVKGIAWRTIERAKAKLGIQHKKIGPNWSWSWRT